MQRKPKTQGCSFSYQQRAYVKNYLETRTDVHPSEETPEMTISKVVAPLISKKIYSAKARDGMGRFKLATDTKGIEHALYTQQLSQRRHYLDDYENDVRGRGPADPAIAFPDTRRVKRATILASNVSFGVPQGVSFVPRGSVLARCILQLVNVT